MPIPHTGPAPAALAPSRTISILGATGSIGASTIDLIRRDRSRYEIEALSANRNGQALAGLARELGARFAAVGDPSAYGELKEALAGSGIEAGAGPEALIEAGARPAEWVMAAITGASGLAPTIAAIARGATVALANKECLVCAGDFFMREAARRGATILPVDSEHNAVFQALMSGQRGEVRRVILTASGGPFRTWSLEQMRGVTREQALKHPNWAMGPKITIDSSTLMNKGLELIEAHHLFGLGRDRLDVVVHPQSVIHGMVEFHDGSVIAQLGAPDMRIPISHCLGWPARIDGPAPRLNLAEVATLQFEAPDLLRFPALRLALEALEEGGGAPTILNAANEVAVAQFLEGRLSYLAIADLVEATLERAKSKGVVRAPDSVESALEMDGEGRALAGELLPEIAAKRV